MKKLILALIIALPLLSQAQVHLGNTLSQIKNLHPKNTFKIQYSPTGVKCAYTEISESRFFYYFDKKTGLVDRCIQILNDNNGVNFQVEAYNKKYVIVSDTSWKAYLEGGKLLRINLFYEKKAKTYFFSYTY